MNLDMNSLNFLQIWKISENLIIQLKNKYKTLQSNKHLYITYGCHFVRSIWTPILLLGFFQCQRREYRESPLRSTISYCDYFNLETISVISPDCPMVCVYKSLDRVWSSLIRCQSTRDRWHLTIDTVLILTVTLIIFRHLLNF